MISRGYNINKLINIFRNILKLSNNDKKLKIICKINLKIIINSKRVQ